MSQSWSSRDVDSYNIWNSMFPSTVFQELHKPVKRINKSPLITIKKKEEQSTQKDQ